MTVENIQINGNQIQHSENEGNVATLAEHEPNDSTEKDKGVVALSLKDNSEKASQSLNLVRRPSSILPGNRPIEPSHLKIVNTYSSVGSSRPITASEMKVSGTLTISGKRPISSSHLQISQSYSVMGNRPVASNEAEEFTDLMGYID